jgi:hypothetical protein
MKLPTFLKKINLPLSTKLNTMLTTQKAQTILLSVLGLLLIPLIAMQFTNEVNWTFLDFIVAGGVLHSLAFSINYIFQKVKNKANRLLILFGTLFIFFLLWAELAVGIFSSPIAGS